MHEAKKPLLTSTNKTIEQIDQEVIAMQEGWELESRIREEPVITLRQAVETFKDDLKPILKAKFEELLPEFERLGKELKAEKDRRKNAFVDIMEKKNIPEEEWQLYWAFAMLYFQSDCREQIDRFANINAQLENIRQAWSILMFITGEKTGGEIDVDMARTVPLETLVSSKIIKAGGGKLKTNCPFHAEDTPSFFIYQNTNSYYCYGCGKGGDVIKFIMDLEGLTFIDAVRRLNG